MSSGGPIPDRIARERARDGRAADQRERARTRPARATAQRVSAARAARSAPARPRSPAKATWSGHTYEFEIGRNVPAVLARAAKRLAGESGAAFSTAQLRELRRVARAAGRLDDPQRMFLAGLLDAENARVLARTPIRAGATIGFSLGSIRAGMPQVRALSRPPTSGGTHSAPLNRSAAHGRAQARPSWADHAYEFEIGREVPAALARTAKRLAGGSGAPFTTAQLRELRRVAREHGRLDDPQRMFLAGLLDGENARVLARTPIRAGATIGFSLASIRAGMPQVRALGRPRSPVAPDGRTREAVIQRVPAPPTVQGPGKSAPLKQYRETPSDVGQWRDVIVGELDAWSTDASKIFGAFVEAAHAGKFVQLQDRIDMARVFKELGPWTAVELGMLGPVTSGRDELTERRVEWIAKMTGDIGPMCAEVFIHRMLAAMYTDDAVDLMRGLQANARIKTTIALMPAVQDLLRRKGIMAEAWSDREGKGSDFWRSAWEALQRNAYSQQKDPVYWYKWQALPPDYKAWADAAEEEATRQWLSPSNVAKGMIDYVTFGLSSAVTSLAVDTPKGIYHLASGEYQEAGPELVGLMVMAATWGVSKGIKVLGDRAAGLETGSVILDSSGPKSKALARLEAILNANPASKAAAASLSNLSVSEIEAGGRYVSGNSANAAFVYRGGSQALKALIDAGGDLRKAEAQLRALRPPAQLPAGEPGEPAVAEPVKPEPGPTAPEAPTETKAEPPAETKPAATEVKQQPPPETPKETKPTTTEVQEPPPKTPEGTKPAATEVKKPEPKPPAPAKAAPQRPLREYIPEAGPEFSEWFDSLTLEELDKYLADPGAREAIASKIRHPGTYHEWLMVAEARRFKRWRVSMRTVLTARTRTGATIGTGFRHGGTGSSTFHLQLRAMITSSRTYNDFLMKLNYWADTNLSPSFSERWPFDVRRGRYSLPPELQLPGEGARGGNR